MSIRVFEWRDTAVASSYPLDGNDSLIGLFSDASFVQFDGFIPVLVSAEVLAAGINFNFTLDDGPFTYFLASSLCNDGQVIILSNANRYYGTIVCGSHVNTIYNGNNGSTITITTNFLPITVRTLPSISGLFGLQGLYGAVSISTDENQKLTVESQSVTWDTVSKPSNTDQYTLSSSKLYSVTNTGQFLEIDPIALTSTTLFTAPKAYNSILATAGKLYGVFGEEVYDLTSLPPTLLYTHTSNIISLALNNSSSVVGLTVDGNLITFNSGLTAVSSSVALPTNTALGKAFTILSGNIAALPSPGPYDTSTSSNMSDFISLYSSGVVTLQGLFGVAGNNYQPPFYGFALAGSGSYAVTSNNTVSNIVNMNVLNCDGTNILAISYDATVGSLQSLTSGANVVVTLNEITPLQLINSTAPTSNSINIIGSDLIQVQQTNPDELTISLAVDPDDTVITRTTKYSS